MNTDKVTRLEIIDHTMCENCGGQGGDEEVFCTECGDSGMNGREVIFWDKDKKIRLSMQDEDRTLKIFITERQYEY